MSFVWAFPDVQSGYKVGCVRHKEEIIVAVIVNFAWAWDLPILVPSIYQQEHPCLESCRVSCCLHHKMGLFAIPHVYNIQMRRRFVVICRTHLNPHQERFLIGHDFVSCLLGFNDVIARAQLVQPLTGYI